jgi:hypothetical protein
VSGETGPEEPGRTDPVGAAPDEDNPGDGVPDEDDPGDGVPDEEENTGAFRRTRGRVSARFTASQAVILRNLVGQVAELMGDATADPAAADLASPSASGPGGPPLSAEDLAAMLGATGPAAPPDDPVLARLLPDAYRDDPEAAGEFRRYTEQGLRSGKAAAARTVLATLPAEGGQVRLGPDDAQAWLRALNDVRLAIGTVLGVTEDYEDDLAQASWGDPRSAYLEVYHWLGYIQDSLVRALSR